MPLAFESLSHGTIAFGDFSKRSSLIDVPDGLYRNAKNVFA
jgi:hypothetical protein